MKTALLLCLPAMASCALFDQSSRPFPTWRVYGAARPVGTCATVEPWVVKSGAEGIGIVVEAKGLSSCTLVLSGVELRVRGEPLVEHAVSLAPAAMTPGVAFRTYVSLAFDNRGQWNRGVREANVVVRGTIDGQPFEVGPWAMQHLTREEP